MNTVEELEKIIVSGFENKNSAIKPEDIEKLEKAFRELDGDNRNKGYTLPQVDTIGMNLSGKFACNIQDY